MRVKDRSAYSSLKIKLALKRFVILFISKD